MEARHLVLVSTRGGVGACGRSGRVPTVDKARSKTASDSGPSVGLDFKENEACRTATIYSGR